MADDEKVVCIGGNKYRVVGDGSYNLPKGSTSDMSITEQKLTRLVNLAGGGEIGGGYRSVKVDVPAHETAYEINLGIHATQLNIRCDQAVVVKLNSVQADDIFIEVSEFPFSISELKLNESIHTMFITTGDDSATVKILAFGMVI